MTSMTHSGRMVEPVTSDNGQIDVPYWSKRWETQKTGWHMQTPNTGLTSNIHLLYKQPNKHDVSQTPTFFIPLCGKTVDMQYLNDIGYNVVGIEGVELSVKQYFDEQAEHYTDVQHNSIGNDIIKYTAKHTKSGTTIAIFVGDLFNTHLTPDVTGPLHVLFDRGSLVALQPSDRQRYSDKIVELVVPVTESVVNYILQVVEYNEKNADGTLSYSPPPHNTPQTVVEQLYKSRSTKFEIIKRRDDMEKEGKRSSDLKYWYVVEYGIGLGKQ